MPAPAVPRSVDEGQECIMNKNRNGPAFSLIEVLVVMLILAVIGAASFTVVMRRPSAKYEAEQAMRWLYSILARSDSRGVSFALRLDSSALHPGLTADWENKGVNVDRWDAGEGCRLKRVFSGGGTSAIMYSPQWGTFTPALTVEVTGGRGDVYYLIVSGQGRLRISETPPTD